MMHRVLPLFLLLGLTLPAAGALVLGPEKPVSPITTGPSSEDDRLSDAATDGTDFLVVWSSGWSTVHGVFAAKVAENGAVSPKPSLRLDSRDAIDVRVVWAGDAYLVLWTDTTRGILGARIDRDGNLIAPPFLVSTWKYVHAAAWDGRRVVAISNIPGGTKILVLGPSGNVVRETDVPGVPIGGEARLLAAGGGFVLVWANNQRVGNAAVRAMRISPDGDAEAPVDLPQAQSLGVSFDADTDGERIGVANQVVASGALLEASRGLVKSILANGPLALARCIYVVNQGADLPLDDALELEAKVFGELTATADMREGTSAFLEKRAPAFRGS